MAIRAAGGWNWAALLVALIGLGGSLFLSLGMGFKACPLCFYQRTFMMSLVGVLAMGLLTRSGRLSLLALPLGAGGLGVALFHVYLEMADKLECPPGIFGLGTSPQQSLALFVVLVALLVVDVLGSKTEGAFRWPALVATFLIGGVFAVASCISNPPMPPAPKEPYAKPPDICRPPYRPG